MSKKMDTLLGAVERVGDLIAEALDFLKEWKKEELLEPARLINGEFKGIMELLKVATDSSNPDVAMRKYWAKVHNASKVLFPSWEHKTLTWSKLMDALELVLSKGRGYRCQALMVYQDFVQARIELGVIHYLSDMCEDDSHTGPCISWDGAKTHLDSTQKHLMDYEQNVLEALNLKDVLRLKLTDREMAGAGPGEAEFKVRQHKKLFELWRSRMGRPRTKQAPVTCPSCPWEGCYLCSRCTPQQYNAATIDTSKEFTKNRAYSRDLTFQKEWTHFYTNYRGKYWRFTRRQGRQNGVTMRQYTRSAWQTEVKWEERSGTCVKKECNYHPTLGNLCQNIPFRYKWKDPPRWYQAQRCSIDELSQGSCAYASWKQSICY